MSKQATLYRMVTDKHICPFGIKAKDLLERHGYGVDDHWLKSREETDLFKEKHEVKTTPQVFINGERVGGYDALRDYLDLSPVGQKGRTYKPVVAIFSITALLSIALSYAQSEGVMSMLTLMQFIALSMAVLAVQKLQDLYRFSNSFITYDLLGMKWVRYAYIYPFLEAYVGIAMLAQIPPLFYAPVSLLIGSIGAISVFKAVYIDRRELKCACVGGDSNVPLGFISLTENLFMIGAGCYMLLKAL